MKNNNINVLMIGGRRAGKTSIMAAVDECCTSTFRGNADIKIEVVQGGPLLSAKQIEMMDYFKKPEYTGKNMFIPDLTPSNAIDTYIYKAKIKKTAFHFTFTDVPGEVYSDMEWIAKSEDLNVKEIHDKLSALIEQNHVIIIAIDTPHMVEYPHNPDGLCQYHMYFNRVKAITDLIKDNFTADEDKLVVFVPLKCEKYFYNGKINEIAEYIEKGYSDLLEYFRSVGPNSRFTVINNPIMTLGGAEFYKFDNEGAERAVGNYCYVMDLTKRQYSPQFCDDPMLLILLYMIQIAKKRKNQQGKLTRWFSEKWQHKASMDDLLSVERELREKLNANKPEGFCVFQDPLDIQNGSN